MRHETRIRFMRMAVILAMFGYTAATLAASGSFEKNIAVSDGVIVDVTNLNGDVVVRGANVDEVTVHTESGDVRVSGVTGPVNATSDKGDVTVA